MTKRITILCCFLSLLLISGIATAQQSTKVVVRVKATDAKFIGSSMGGALIKIKNTETGALMVKGLTEGSTGNTKKTVISPQKRYEELNTKGSAKFVSHLNIDEPIYATISATSTYRDTKEVTVSTQMWIIPGKDITGDGILLEMPGFVVDVTNTAVREQEGSQRTVAFKTKVVMMCGCPTEPGGLWDSSKFEMTALIKKDGETVQQVPLTFSGKTNFYDGNFTISSPGTYKIVAIVFDPRTENSGVAKETVTLN